MRRAALWLWFCALALRLQPALPQTVATNVPPEDQDGSGDDSDNFSGSGADALQDITLSHQTPSTWKDMWFLTTVPTTAEPTLVETVAASILPNLEEHVDEASVHMTKVEPDTPVPEEETSHPPSEITQHPATHRASTARASTAQAPATTYSPRDLQPDHYENLPPKGRGHFHPPVPSLEEGAPSATEKAAEDGASSQLPVEESSGDPDFTFDTASESTGESLDPDFRSQNPGTPGAPGASKGLLDRKEVLGGVIAGGLVGLIFAVCLVGFMLYRMKKKDEGSYSLEEPKQANGGAYQKPTKQEEFYA
ncbi:syndecan-1 [Rhynchocyon petersi]